MAERIHILEIPMVSDDRAADCPEETRCQLELVADGDRDVDAIELVDVEGMSNTKQLNIGVVQRDSGCDYTLNIGMVGSLPEEYVLVSIGYQQQWVYTLFDLAANAKVDPETFEPREGSPELSGGFPQVIDRDTEPYPFQLMVWLTYNFDEASTPITTSYSADNPAIACPISLQWPEPWTYEYGGWWDDVGIHPGELDNYDDSGGTYTWTCNDDHGKVVREEYARYGSNDPITSWRNKTWTLPRWQGYEIRDDAGGSTDVWFNAYYTFAENTEASTKDQTRSTTLSAKIGNTSEFTIYNRSFVWHQEGDPVTLTTGETQVDNAPMIGGIGDPWFFRVVAGQEYICCLGGAPLGVQVVTGASYPDVSEESDTVVPIPAIVLIDQIDIEPETNLISVAECVDKSLPSRNEALAACIKELYEYYFDQFPDITDAHRNYMLGYGPIIEMKAKKEVE